MSSRREVLTAARALPVVQVLARAGRETGRNGQGWECPVCGEKKRCGVIRKDPVAWYCHGCTAGGSSADLWLLLQGLDVKQLGEREWDALRVLVDMPEVAVVQRVTRPPLSWHQIDRYWRGCGSSRAVRSWIEARGLRPGGDWVRSWPVGWESPVRHAERLQLALSSGECAVYPLRGIDSGLVRQLVVRPLNPPMVLEGGKWKPLKSVTVNSGGGACEEEGLPLIYGRVLLGMEGVVVVEGAMDRALMEQLLPGRYCVIGARCESEIPALAGLLLKMGKPCWLVPHLDKPKAGKEQGIGWWRMAQLASAVRQGGGRAMVWPWEWMAQAAGTTVEAWRALGVTDMDDLIRADGRVPVMERGFLMALVRRVVVGEG